MFTVYILFSKGLQKYYTGQTQNMENRLREHNSGETKSIRSGIPWKLIWTKNVETRIEAVQPQT
ncbi:MAG: GIY-YIG nuclease family protein [Chitinophagaceae bacterium]|nr:GIY-YIG nuclease family protein [Chitinophagaceae bacterium]